MLLVVLLRHVISLCHYYHIRLLVQPNLSKFLYEHYFSLKSNKYFQVFSKSTFHVPVFPLSAAY